MATSNMGLTVWGATDVFNYQQLADNFTAIDSHNHTSTKGAKIPYGGLDAGAVKNTQVASDAAIDASKILGTAVTRADVAGGDLVGSYPNPTIGAGKVTFSKIQTGLVPNPISGSSTGTGLPTGLNSTSDVGYMIDYNFSKTVPTGYVSAGTTEYFVWRLRWNGSTWDCIGGFPMAYSNITSFTTSSSSFTANGMSINLPFQGNYLVSYSVTGQYAATMAPVAGTSPTSYDRSYTIFATLYNNTTVISRSGSYTSMAQNLVAGTPPTIGTGSNSGTATNSLKISIDSNKIVKMGVARGDGPGDLTVSAQSIVITPIGGLSA